MRLPNDNRLTLADDNTELIIDDSEIPAPDNAAVAALLPRYAQEGDSVMRRAVLSAWRVMVNFLWARIGLYLAAQMSPRFAAGAQLDAWQPDYKRARVAGEEDPQYRTRLLTTVDHVTPQAIQGVVRQLVAEVTTVPPAFLEPAVDAAFSAPLEGCPWAAFMQPAQGRLWADDPTNLNKTTGAYAAPAITYPQFWIIVPGDAGDDLQAPHSLTPDAAQSVDPIDFLGVDEPGWTRQASMAVPRRNAAAVRLNDGRFLLTGGDDGTNALASCEIYDPKTKTFGPVANMITARTLHSAVVLGDGRVLVLGGVTAYASLTPTSASELYDPQFNTWTATPTPMTNARFSAPALALNDGRVLVVGGSAPTNVGLAGCELFDPITNTWTAAASLLRARSLYLNAVVLASGRVLVAGGFDGTQPIAECEVYAPEPEGPGSWAAAPAMNVAREGSSQVRTRDGRVLVAGGIGTTGLTIADAELYDETDGPAGRWRVIPAMPQRRAFASVLELGDGRILIIGGHTSFSTTTNACQLFDPINNTWRAAAALNVPRYGTSQLLVAPDQVLVLSGSNPEAAGTTELFAPALTEWNFTPRAPDSLMERIRSEVEQRRAGGVTWWAYQDPFLEGAK